MEIKISGEFDDVIKITGDWETEFSWCNTGTYDVRYLVFSDGTIIRPYYDKEEIWRFELQWLSENTKYTKADWESINTDEDDEEPSDVITLTGDFDWVAFTNELIFTPKAKCKLIKGKTKKK